MLKNQDFDASDLAPMNLAKIKGSKHAHSLADQKKTGPSHKARQPRLKSITNIQVSLAQALTDYLRLMLFQVLSVETLDLVKRDSVLSAAIIQIRMHHARNDHEFLVVCILASLCHGRVGVS